MTAAGIPELPEAAADPAIRKVFQDIRSTLGVTIINLIYRHLALQPDVLAGVWATIKTHAASGTLFRDAAVLHAYVQSIIAAAEIRPLPADILRPCGIRPAEQRTILAVIRAYNRANLLNLIGLSLIVDLPGRPLAAPARGEAMLPAGEEDELPALPTWEHMAPEVAAMVHCLNRIGEAEPPGIVASLYRHLSYWPEALALLYASLAQLHDSGRALKMRDDVCGVAIGLQRKARPPIVLSPSLHETLQELAGRTIARMIPIGMIAERLFSAPEYQNLPRSGSQNT